MVLLVTVLRFGRCALSILCTGQSSANHSGHTCVAAPLSVIMWVLSVVIIWSSLLPLPIIAMTWIGILSLLPAVGGIDGNANGC